MSRFFFRPAIWSVSIQWGDVGTLLVITPGLQTTVQDLGRWGFQAQGVPVAGPMDPRSHRVANALVGNSRDAATLEVALIGPELSFDDERLVAVSGAVFDMTVDGNPVADHEAHPVKAGSHLCFGRRMSGARAYIAVSGGIDAPLTLGSRATHLVSRMGGINGRALRAGDRLPLVRMGESSRSVSRTAAKAVCDHVEVRPASGSTCRVRVLAGPQEDRFVDDALEVLQSGPYSVGPTSDRMGFRLSGPSLRHRGPVDIISDATPFGTLQVPASGAPVLLAADRQTTGGYPKLATVITADLAVVGQTTPGDALVFEVCTERAALAALIAEERGLMALEDRGQRNPRDLR